MKLTHAKNRRQAGVSIIEVVVAAALLLVVVVPILRALTAAQVTRRTVEQETQSLVLAQAKVSEIQGVTVYNFSSNYDETGTSLGGSYLCNVSDNEHATLKTLSVSVGYDADGNGSLASSEIKVTLTTLVAKRD
jgi:Tfp pilus assembly protein PilV